jgi:Ca2+-binding RTX toxin-like protein
MAWQYPQSTTSDATIVTLDEDGESVFIAREVFIASTLFEPTIHATVGANNHSIVVAGTVAGYTAIHVGGYYNVNNGSVVTVEQTGQVRSPDGVAIALEGYNMQVANHGLITAHHLGVEFHGSSATGASSIVNTGTIEASVGIYHGRHSTQVLKVFNSGTIEGSIASFDTSSESIGRNEITNTGTMIGHVQFAGADDLYDGRLGTIQGDVLGRGGIDRLYAGTGNNRLFGGDGNDTLMGGAGADYLSGGTGSDRAAYTTAKAGLTVSLANASLNTGDAKGDTFNSIENLTGSDFSDYLFGTNTRNVISGGAGNDTIKGYRGNDTLAGGTGKDSFVFNSALSASTNVDTITDFRAVDDTIHLDNAYFAALTSTGVLAAGAFRVHPTGLAQDSSDRIIYESDTGELYYDANGNAAGGGVLFAKLDPGLALTNADFVVI